MCMTYRHDYGLSKEDLPEDYPFKDIVSGTTESERKRIHMQMSSIYDHHIAPWRKIIEDTLKELPVGHVPSHTPDSIPQHVRYYVQNFTRIEREMDKLVDIARPFCKQCKTNLVYYDGWHCECESVDAFKDWECFEKLS